MNQPEIEIVIPVYNEIEIIERLHSRVTATCMKLNRNFRITYIDDGSGDGTPNWIADHAIAGPATDRKSIEGQRHSAATATNHDPAISRGVIGQVALLKLSRNFGHAAAVHAGIQQSTGRCVVVMDGDLQDPPELIEEMVSRWESGDEIVIAQRTSRQETLFRGIAFRTFHRLFGYLSDADIPRNTGTFCLMDRRAVDAISTMKESHQFLPGLRAWVGFRQSLLGFDRDARGAGQPKQTFVRLFRYALDAIFGFSFKPLRLLTVTGATVFLFAIAVAGWFVVKRMMGWEMASIGFTTLMATVLALGGFQLMALGLIGEYIGRIYDEVKNRPQYLVADRIQSEVRSLPQLHNAENRAA
jgi:dolichol-phosphate mannosyltransferase